MSKMIEFMRLEAKIAAEMEALERMKEDAGLQEEIKFVEELREVIAKHGKTDSDAVRLLNPGAVASRASAEPGRTRKRRKLKVYTNPHNGEVIETRGGNHNLLREWKAEHGDDVVESWITEERE